MPALGRMRTLSSIPSPLDYDRPETPNCAAHQNSEGDPSLHPRWRAEMIPPQERQCKVVVHSAGLPLYRDALPSLSACSGSNAVSQRRENSSIWCLTPTNSDEVPSHKPKPQAHQTGSVRLHSTSGLRRECAHRQQTDEDKQIEYGYRSMRSPTAVSLGCNGPLAQPKPASPYVAPVTQGQRKSEQAGRQLSQQEKDQRPEKKAVCHPRLQRKKKHRSVCSHQPQCDRDELCDVQQHSP